MSTSYEYLFVGAILPERAHFHNSHYVTGKFKADLAFSGEYLIEIKSNQVSIKLELAQQIKDNLADLTSVVRDLVWREIEIVSLHIFTYHYFDLRFFLDNQSGVTSFFGVSYADDIPITNIEINGDLRRIAGENPFFRMALSDFRRALEVPSDTGLYCYRAYEALLQNCRDERKIKKSDAVVFLSKHLHYAEEWGNFLRDINSEVRHARPVTILGRDRDRAIGFTRELLFRFCAWKGAAPKTDFEFLPYK